MTPNGRVFDSSLDRGFPYDIRVGSGQASTFRVYHATPTSCVITNRSQAELHLKSAQSLLPDHALDVLQPLLIVQIVAGLDEGLASMKVGGLRRLYIPGNLSFPKGLPSGPGRYAFCPCCLCLCG